MTVIDSQLKGDISSVTKAMQPGVKNSNTLSNELEILTEINNT